MSEGGDDWKTALAKRAYEDGAKSTVKVIGDALQGVARMVFGTAATAFHAGADRLQTLAERVTGRIPASEPTPRCSA